MAGNSLGTNFRITTFGESHGPAIGVIIDGCPPGIEWDEEWVQYMLSKRRPGQSKVVTQRDEKDRLSVLSGVFKGKTTGTPLMILIQNKDARSRDYDHIKNVYRPSHADFTYDKKYGHRDYRGGGRSSARETACRVAAGAVAMKILEKKGIKIVAFVSRIYDVVLQKQSTLPKRAVIDASLVRCPEARTSDKMIDVIDKVRKEGNTVGGYISCMVDGLEPGVGEPVFDKLEAQLAHAMMSIPATKGFEVGSGFSSIEMKGSEHNDNFIKEDDTIITKTNNSGGIQGGISNGMPLIMRIAFKPVSTIMRDQETVDSRGDKATARGKGRHDPCVVPRAVPIVESMAALVLLDQLMSHQAQNTFMEE